LPYVPIFFYFGFRNPEFSTSRENSVPVFSNKKSLPRDGKAFYKEKDILKV
jgi:hypothetical protein